ncbi:MAG: hypothetical protein K2M95_02640, partial [Clostridiales bacterium]|nr:hypothetical protein [Clostridiales bacterium]
MGVDFAANASSKAIKEDISLSAAPDDTGSSVTYTTSIDTTNKRYVYTFNYTGAIQQITLPAGRYKLEVWGAQGGNWDTSYPAGKGGYSYGEIIFSTQQTLYVAVGGQGLSVNATNAGGAGGGWNGGGNVASTSGRGGGGATHIATVKRGTGTNSGALSNYNSYRGEILMVAGGGGGNCHSFAYAGGGGGGFNGGQSGANNGWNAVYENSCTGYGGTLSAGGGHAKKSGGHTTQLTTGDTYSGYSTSVTNGSFGQGGTGTTWGSG